MFLPISLRPPKLIIFSFSAKWNHFSLSCGRRAASPGGSRWDFVRPLPAAFSSLRNCWPARQANVRNKTKTPGGPGERPRLAATERPACPPRSADAVSILFHAPEGAQRTNLRCRGQPRGTYLIQYTTPAGKSIHFFWSAAHGGGEGVDWTGASSPRRPAHAAATRPPKGAEFSAPPSSRARGDRRAPKGAEFSGLRRPAHAATAGPPKGPNSQGSVITRAATTRPPKGRILRAPVTTRATTTRPQKGRIFRAPGAAHARRQGPALEHPQPCIIK